MAIGGRYATRRVVLTPGADSSTTGVSLMALTERVHSDGAIPPGRKCFLLMMGAIWRIRADMRNQGYNLPDWVGKTSYQC